MNDLKNYEVWFVTGSQHLYGEDTLRHVASHAREIAGALNDSGSIPVRIVDKGLATTPAEIYQVCQAANAAPACIGLMAWMHTFSPAKMWIRGL
ncbi:MAG: L-arabinose isomerase, partial [Cytophagales bacterium]|nr:L-arabinose isomerase [Cytophagales bacterium]